MTNRVKFALATTVGIVALLIAGNVWLTPKYITATDAEVRRNIDPELLKPFSKQLGAVDRTQELSKRLEKVVQNYPSRPPVSGKLVPPSALNIVDPNIVAIKQLLSSGPLYRVPKNMFGDDFPEGARYKAFAKSIVQAVVEDCARKDWTEAEEQLNLALLFHKRLQESDSTLIQYFVSIAIISIIEQELIDLAKGGDMPIGMGKRMLAQLPETSSSDDSLAQAVRGDFQLSVLPRLADPRTWARNAENNLPASIAALREMSNNEKPKNDLYGSYDAILTTQLQSAQYAENIRNTTRRPSEITEAAHLMANKLQDSLPEMPETDGTLKKDLELRWWQYRMNFIPNSIGRMSLYGQGSRELMKISYKARTRQDRVRAALAVAIYRSEMHCNPTSFDDLIEAHLLSSEPYDYQADKPLAFDLKVLFARPKAKLP